MSIYPPSVLAVLSRPELNPSDYSSDESDWELTEEEAAALREMDEKKADRRRVAEQKALRPLRTQEEVVAEMVQEFNARKAEREAYAASVCDAKRRKTE